MPGNEGGKRLRVSLCSFYRSEAMSAESVRGPFSDGESGQASQTGKETIRRMADGVGARRRSGVERAGEKIAVHGKRDDARQREDGDKIASSGKPFCRLRGCRFRARQKKPRHVQ
jgi:hypothetical protein